MGFFRGVGKVMGHMFNFKVDQWLDYNRLKYSTNYLINTAKNLFAREEAARRETFGEAYVRLSWTESFLRNQIAQLTAFIHLFSASSCLLFLYSCYVFFTGSFMSTTLSFALTIFSCTQVFRYHFWRFQLQNRKLGSTLREWFQSLLTRNP